MKQLSMRIEYDPEEIIKTYSDMVYRLAFARTGTKEDADEIYQEVFLPRQGMSGFLWKEWN